MVTSRQIEPAIKTNHLESLANNTQSSSVVCFNQHPAQPKVACSAEVDTVNSGLETEHADNSAVGFHKWDRSICQPTIKLAQDGLIKISSTTLGDSPRPLEDFCKF